MQDSEKVVIRLKWGSLVLGSTLSTTSLVRLRGKWAGEWIGSGLGKDGERAGDGQGEGLGNGQRRC